jgi:hypothetical protein
MQEESQYILYVTGEEDKDELNVQLQDGRNI